VPTGEEPGRAYEQPGSRRESTMRCPTCRAADLSEIDLLLRGRRVTMHACSRCEIRWWDDEGEQVALHHVIRMARPS
jgi:hypothetical protein